VGFCHAMSVLISLFIHLILMSNALMVLLLFFRSQAVEAHIAGDTESLLRIKEEEVCNIC